MDAGTVSTRLLGIPRQTHSVEGISMSRKPKSTTVSKPDQSVGERNAELALQPSVNSAAIIQTFAGKTVGEPDINYLVKGLLDTFVTVNDGDLSSLESMLAGQAMALQTIFCSLARRAQVQTSQRNLEAFLSLALKAQNQSRATIATLAELKFPRQAATFVKQTNVAHGAQQINNHLEPGAGSRTEEIQSQQTKLLVGHNDGGTAMDTRATTTAGGSNPALQAMATLHRPDKRSGKG
jgi:hypothetical protein